MRENDWLVASINNPDFNNQDFKDILGMDMGNTQILPYQSYLSSPFITQNDLFKDNNGNFSETKFKDYYNSQLTNFQAFSSDDSTIDNFEYSIFDPNKKATSRVKDPNFRMNIITNPDRVSVGISGRNQQEASPFSSSELAQQSKIYDSATGTFLDYSPNDISFTSSPLKWISSLFQDPLVKATWDSDGTHIDPISHQEIEHKKGEYKLNDDGQYYYETLNGRSPLNKETLSAFDILTTDGEGMNKYDFLDSDGLDKSVTGTLAKTALAVAPLFLGGPVAAVYSGALVARELVKSFPMLYGMSTSLFGADSDSKLLNTLSAFGDKFTTSNSQYAKQHTFAFENFASLVADVATQWGQQKAIANTISKLKGGENQITKATEKAYNWYQQEANKIISTAQGAEKSGDMSALAALQYLATDPKNWESSALGRAAITKFVKPAQELAQKNMRLGADASLAYMAIVSNTDVYATMLDHGASKRDAAAIALGSTIGMFGVDKYLHLGELFFDELSQETKVAVRKAIKKEATAMAEDWAKQGSKEATKNDTSKLTSLIMKGISFGKNIAGKYADDLANHTTGFIGKAMGEGLEETAEELVTDLSKQMYQIAGQFGPNIINQSGITDVGAWENAADRYLMNFLGGAVGGGLFYGVDVIQNNRFIRDSSQDDLVYLISNGKRDELLSELDKMKSKGLGNKNLSATKIETSESGDPVYLTADDEKDSQNEFIYNKIKDSINQIDGILSYQGTKLSDDALFEQMVLKEHRFLQLKDMFKDASYATRYQQDFRKMQKDLLLAESALEAAYKTEDGTPTGKILPDAASTHIKDNPVRQANLQKAEQEVARLKTERDKFLKGEYSLPYTEKMLFALDTFLNIPFMSGTYESWVKNNKGKSIAELSDSEKEAFKKEYLEYKKIKQAQDLTEAFDLYKQIKAKVDPHIQTLQENASSFRTNSEKLQWLISEKGPLAKLTQLSWNQKLDGETDEDLKFLKEKREGETDEEFKTRLTDRAETIRKFNEDQWNNLKTSILQTIDEAGGYIDPSTARQIAVALSLSKNDVQKAVIQDFQNSLYSTGISHLMDLAKNLNIVNPDLSNLDEVQGKLEQSYMRNLSNTYNENTDRQVDIIDYLKTLFEQYGFTGVQERMRQSFIDDVRSGKLKKFIEELGGTKTWEDIRKLSDEEIVSYLERDPNSIYRNYYVRKGISSQDIQDFLDAINPNTEETSQQINNFPELLTDENAKNAMENAWGDDMDEEYFEEQSAITLGLLKSYLDRLANGEAFLIQGDPWRLTLEISLSDEALNALGLTSKNQLIRQELDSLEIPQTFDQLRSDMQGNAILSLYREIQGKLSSKNPIIELINSVQILQGNEKNSIESLLTKIHQRFMENSSQDFTLSEDEQEALEKAVKTLQLMQSYIYAAGTDVHYTNPIGHNKVINDIARNHKDIYPNFIELPTLDQDVAQMYIQEIQKFLGELTTDSPTSWVNLSLQNQVNKIRKLQIADKKLVEAKLEFLNVLTQNRDNLKFSYNDKTYDLLDGIDTITDSDPNIKLHKIENLLYINVHKVLQTGMSFKVLLEQSGIISKILNLSEIANQRTTAIDENISYGKLTDYDKFVYLISTIGISSNEFYNFINSKLKDTENNIEDKEKAVVPITIQEYTSRIALSKIKNSQIISDALSYIQETVASNPLHSGKITLDRIMFIDGNAGVGKTKVIAKNILAYLNTEDVWLAAPEKTQRDTLKEIIGTGEPLVLKELFEKILGANFYQQLKSDCKDGKSLSNREDIDFVDIDNYPLFKVNFDKIKFNSIDKVPKAIIIDEGTYMNMVEYQILNKFAQDNDIQVVVLGDTDQNGSNDVCGTLSRYGSLFLQSSKLSISLRDVNLQKYKNLQKVISLSRPLRELEMGTSEGDNFALNLQGLIKSIQFEVYNKEVLEGDLITSAIEPEQVKKLSGTIGFIGDTNGVTYQTLSKNLPDSCTLTTMSVSEIQGQEFDYVVVDTSWDKLTPIREGHEEDLAPYFDFLQKLYTLMSRGRRGSIFIDNGLTQNIGQNRQTNTRALAPNLQNAVKPFVVSKRAIIDSLNLVPNDKFEKLITSEISKEKESEDQKEESKKEKESKKEGNQEENTLVDSEEENNTLTPEEQKILDNKINEELQRDSVDFESFIKEASKESCRFYGSIHLSGLRKTKNSKGKNIWEVPIGQSTKQDLQIFIPENTTSIEEGKAIDDLVKKLLSLKSYFLYRKEGNLPSDITQIVSLDNLKNVSYELEVRSKQDTDNFVGFTGLSEDKLPINDLVYTIVAKFKNNNGEDCKLTLGALANPDSWIIENDSPTRDSDISKKNTYISIIQTLSSHHKTNEDFSISITPQFSGLTDIRRTTSASGTRHKVPVTTLSEFRERHPYLRISNPYVLMGDIPGVSGKLKGKGVVFVSSNLNLTENQLQEEYLASKRSTAENHESDPFNLSSVPQVRMLVLDSRGIFFDDIAYKSHFQKYIPKGVNSSWAYPFDQDFMGVRMFVSMWNYRANLLNFMQAYENFKNTNNYSDEDIERIAKVESYNYRKSQGEDVPELSGVTATKEELESLRQFNSNNQLGNLARQFRLGYSENKSGCYIRKLDVDSENSFYTGVKDPKGIYLTYGLANRQLKILNGLFDNVLDRVIKLQTGNEEFPKNKPITIKEGFSNSIKGLAKSILDGVPIQLMSNGETYEVTFQGGLKSIPQLITLFSMEVGAWQNLNEDGDQISIGKGDNKQVMSVDFIKEVIAGDPNDTCYKDLMNLVFHGATTPSEKNRATDAYFKNGFYSDPMGHGTATDGQNFKECITSEDLFTVNAEVDMPIGYINLGTLQSTVESIDNSPANAGPSFIDTFLTQYPTLRVKGENTPESIQRKIQSTLKQYFSKKQQNDIIKLLTTPYEVNFDSKQTITVQQFIENKIGDSLQGINIQWDNNTLSFEIADNKWKVEFTKKNTLEITQINNKVENTENYTKQVQDLLTEFIDQTQDDLEESEKTQLKAYIQKKQLSFEDIKQITSIINSISNSEIEDEISDILSNIKSITEKNNC